MKNSISPISVMETYNFFAINSDGTKKNYYDYFAGTIEKIKDFAIAPYFWMIVDYAKMEFIGVSDNIDKLTPFSKDEWLSSTNYYIELFHPKDKYYVLAANVFLAKIAPERNSSGECNLKFNTYGRIQDQQKKYRWALIQSPKHYVNEYNQMEAALIIFYDLSHFQIQNRPLISMIDLRNNEIQYFKHFDQEIKRIDQKVPSITKREKEILILMSQGLNTPEIAEKLFISQQTVENHKYNLRKKTQSKTSVQLITYVMNHSLLFT